MSSKVMVAVVCMLAMPFAPSAYAQSVEANTARVTYGDLNLDTRAGARTLIGRLRQATRQVCGDSARRMTLAEHAKIRECRSQSLGQAVAELDNANVRSMFARHEGGGAPVLYASR